MEEEKGLPQFDFEFSEAAIAEFMYNDLIELGYAPTTDEVFDIAEIVFAYIVEMFCSMGIFDIYIGEDEE